MISIVVLVETTIVVTGSSSSPAGLRVGIIESDFPPVMSFRISVNDRLVDVCKVLGVVSWEVRLVMVEFVKIWRLTCRGK